MSLRQGLESYINNTTCNKSVTDLTRLDLMRMDLVKRETAGNPLEYDYVPWLYFITVAMTLYAKELPQVTESELWHKVMLGNAKWILHITGRLPVTENKLIWAQLLDYVHQRTELLKEIDAHANKN